MMTTSEWTLIKRLRNASPSVAISATKRQTKKFISKTLENIHDFGFGRRINLTAFRKIDSLSFGAQIALNVLGGILISLGATMVILADLGATTTDVLLTGLNQQLGISIAIASFGFLFGLIAFMLAVKARIGLGTVVIPLSVSASFTYSFALIPEPQNIASQLLYFSCGLFVIATGVGTGASAGIGMGVYESICRRLSEMTDWHPQLVRLGWELLILATGILLGGAFGLGTLIAAFATGWILQFMNSAIGDYLVGRRIRTGSKNLIAQGFNHVKD
ncbi:MAG: YczE/YyaS/YitT family protein [Acidimicrobiales bacterium]